MKIKSVRVENFRSIKNETIELDDYTCLVGPNGAGKSNFLRALNIFFGESDLSTPNPRLLTELDFHYGNTTEPIEITVTFIDLSSDARVELKHYYRQDQLIVSALAVFDEQSKQAPVLQFGQRLINKEFAKYFQADSNDAKASELKSIYKELKDEFEELPRVTTKADMEAALREFEENHPEECELQHSNDQFYGYQGTNKLQKYIQWVFIPAVKDAGTEQAETSKTAIGRLLARTVRDSIDFEEDVNLIKSEAEIKYNAMLEKNQHLLETLSRSLSKNLSKWSHPEASMKIAWDDKGGKMIRVDQPVAGILIGEGEFEGDIFRFGHGLQRAIILTLLEELARIESTGETTLLLVCEEPELYQHPPQVRHMADVIRALARSKAQAIITTHSPYFVDGLHFNQVRYVKQLENESVIRKVDIPAVGGLIASKCGKDKYLRVEGTLAKIHQTLLTNVNELFFSNKIVFVEGYEDHAYIVTYLHLMGIWDEFRSQGYSIIPCQGKSHILEPLAIALLLDIPSFVVFDSDSDKPDKNGSLAYHESDNRCILALCDIEDVEPFPTQTYWSNHLVMWEKDIGNSVISDIGSEKWEELKNETNLKYGNIGGLEKNTLFIGSVLTSAWEKGSKSEQLIKLCNLILSYEHG